MDAIAQKKSGFLIPWLAGGIPLTVLLTTLFYLQGRAYQRGYLGYFHIEMSQMDVSSADTMWNAYRGWSNGAARILLSSWQIFRDSVSRTALTAIICLIGAIFILVLLRLGAHKRLAARLPPLPNWRASLKGQIAFMTALLAGYVVAIPAVICLGAFAVALPLLITVESFTSIGARDAANYCDVPAAMIPAIADLPGFDRSKGTIRLLFCATDSCAVLQAGVAYVVPKSTMGVTASMPVSQNMPDMSGTHETLCPNRFK